MSAHSALMSEPPICCICLDGFASPASLPCGHRFCLSCIGEYWRAHGACQCPLCRALFPTRPPLKASAAATEDATAPFKSGEVPCDFCPAKHRAVKSCLKCMASFCASHLEPHYRREDLGRHPLIGVGKNLEDSECPLHGKPLNMFCRSDQTCICVTCVQTEHRGHHVISVGREARKKKDRLKRRMAKLQQAIQERLDRSERVELSSDVGGENPARGQSEEVAARLEEEICALQRTKADLEQLCQTDDSLGFLQGFLHTLSSGWLQDD